MIRILFFIPVICYGGFKFPSNYNENASTLFYPTKQQALDFIKANTTLNRPPLLPDNQPTNPILSTTDTDFFIWHVMCNDTGLTDNHFANSASMLRVFV